MAAFFMEGAGAWGPFFYTGGPLGPLLWNPRCNTRSGQHSLWSAEKRERGNNNSPDSDMPEDMGDGMPEGVS